MAAEGGVLRGSDPRKRLTLKALIGSGDRITLFTLPFVIVGVGANIVFPEAFEVGGPSDALRVVSIVVLIAGVIVWLWSVALILTKARRGELITTGPYAWMKHPIYTSVSLLVLPWVGFLLNTWAGALIGLGLYLGVRRYAPGEETAMAAAFGDRWDTYARSVKFPWL
jgi:protein-S-isoprenylcysteine O-methyltransferase Ste14